MKENKHLISVILFLFTLLFGGVTYFYSFLSERFMGFKEFPINSATIIDNTSNKGDNSFKSGDSSSCGSIVVIHNGSFLVQKYELERLSNIKFNKIYGSNINDEDLENFYYRDHLGINSLKINPHSESHLIFSADTNISLSSFLTETIVKNKGKKLKKCYFVSEYEIIIYALIFITIGWILSNFASFIIRAIHVKTSDLTEDTSELKIIVKNT
ncbi:MAG: hypothetical protein GY855_17050 [candidate division Zixibacteria bacterium]|nr:hypothetical protein [candidate division Zixibacteria bacterium]